jgi:hypothetical protein
MYINLTLPIEWADCITEGGDPEDVDFCSEGFITWLEENPDLRFDHVVEHRVETTEHVVTGCYDGNWLICRTLAFVSSSSRRHTVRKELRISVPKPTVLPLP